MATSIGRDSQAWAVPRAGQGIGAVAAIGPRTAHIQRLVAWVGRARFTALSAAACLVLLSGVVDVGAASSDPEPTWPPAYRAVVEDAANPEPHEVSTDLTAIVEGNPRLSWKAIDGVDHVLVVKLVRDRSTFEDYEGRTFSPAGDLWVTVAPDLRERCRAPGFAGDDLTMRLRQLLGLPPTRPAAAIVEFWVSPERLFRPSPDNEITDMTAGLNLPDDVDAWYRMWFNRLRSRSYFQSRSPANDAYPWTQLGYTYDWSGSGTEVGLSEFVVRLQSDLVVKAIWTIEDYCEDSQE